jgi:hypothetical protein
MNKKLIAILRLCLSFVQVFLQGRNLGKFWNTGIAYSITSNVNWITSWILRISGSSSMHAGTTKQWLCVYISHYETILWSCDACIYLARRRLQVDALGRNSHSREMCTVQETNPTCIVRCDNSVTKNYYTTIHKYGIW